MRQPRRRRQWRRWLGAAGVGLVLTQPAWADPGLNLALDNAWSFSESQLTTTVNYLQTTFGANAYTTYLNSGGTGNNPQSASYGVWSTGNGSNWVSGFFPGQLWLAYEQTGDTAWLTHAKNWTAGLESQKTNTGTDHDIGFIIMTSWGQGLRLGDSQVYRDQAAGIIQTAAATLDTRYNMGGVPVNAIRSWSGIEGQYPICIDNMMNLELLFTGWDVSGRPTSGAAKNWYDHAVSHANVTLAQHLRADGSTYHVVRHYETDPDGAGPKVAGDIERKNTRQGYGDETTWSRGQGWAIHGFTMTYRFTQGDLSVNPQNFLNAARDAADYYIDHAPANFTADVFNYTPGDWVAPSDFDAALGEPVGPWNDASNNGIPGELGDRRLAVGSYTWRDSSAAALAAAGMLELSTYMTAPADRAKYFTAAGNILRSLTRAYAGDPRQQYLGVGSAHMGILQQASANWNTSQQSQPYGDYYFLQALSRYQPNWKTDADGAWSASANWTSGLVHNTPGAVAIFGDRITAPRTVNVDVPMTAGTLVFNSAQGYTLGGPSPATLTLSDPVRAVVQVQAGSHAVSAPIALGSAAQFDVQGAGNTLTLSGTLDDSGGYAVTKTGPGTLRVTGAQTFAAGTAIGIEDGTWSLGGASGTASGAASWTVRPGGTLQLDNASSNHANRLADTASVTLAGGTLALVGAAGGSSESVGALRLAGGASTIATSGGPATLSAASLASRATGATLNIVGSGVAIGGLANTNGIVGGWATHGGTEFATVNAGTLAPLASYTTGDLAGVANPAANVKPTGAQGTVTSRTINSLNLSGSAGVTVGSGQTLTVQSGGIIANTSGSISGGEITAGGSELVLHAAQDVTVGSAVTGSGVSLVKAGGAIATLTNAGNSYGGGTHVAAGTLRLGASGVLPDHSTVQLSRLATLDLAGYSETVGSLAGSGAVQLGAGTLTAGGDGSSTTFSGTIAGSGGLTKAGLGTLTLAGTATHSGPTTVQGGVLAAGGDNVLSAASTVSVGAGAELRLNDTLQTIGALSGAGRVDVGSGLLTTGGSNASTTFSGTLSGAGGVTKTGTGTWTVAGTLAHGGVFNVLGGTVDLQGSDVTVTALATGTTLTNSGGTQRTASLRAISNARFDGTLAGNLALAKTDLGTLALTAASTSNGPVTIANGRLALINSTGSLANASSWTLRGGTALILDSSLGDNANRLGDAAGITLNGATLQVTGRNADVTTTETVGTVTLGAGASTVTVSRGGSTNEVYLALSGLSRSTGGTVNFTNSGGTLGSATVSGNPRITRSGGFTLNDSVIGGWAVVNTNDFATYDNTLGVQDLPDTGRTENDDSTWVATDNVMLTASRTLVAPRTINTLRLSTNGSTLTQAGNALTVDTGGIITPNSTVTITGGTVTSGGSELFLMGSGALVMASQVTGSVSLVVSNSSTVTLSNAGNNYTGGTYLNAGTVRSAAAGVIPDGSAVQMAPGTTLDLNGNSETIGSLAGGGTTGAAGTNVALGAGNLTVGGDHASTQFEGTISGTGAVTKTGSGTWTLVGLNTYTGGTTLAGGTLRGTTSSVWGGIATAPGTSVVLDQATDGTFEGVISGSGSLGKEGLGEVVLLANQTYNGTTTLGGGTLRVSGSAALPNTSAIAIGSGATLAWDSSAALNANLVTVQAGGRLEGAGSLSGDLAVSGTYAGSSTLAGDLNLLSGGELAGTPTITGEVSGGGLVAPGNSPGILTVGQVDPTGGLDFAFEFSATGSPDYTAPSASVNDVLRITDGTTPFAAGLSAGNVVDVYFNVTGLTGSEVFRGGWFTDLNSDFLATVSGASFQFYVKRNQVTAAETIYNGVEYYTLATYNALNGTTFDPELSTVVDTGNFPPNVTGRVTQFVVPEPGTLALLGLGSVAILRRRRQKQL